MTCDIYHNRKRLSDTKDVDMSVNAAYQDVIWKSSEVTEDPNYENPDYVITQQLPEIEATAASFGFTEPTASEYNETPFDANITKPAGHKQGN